MVVARTVTLLRNHSLVIELRISKTLIDPEIELIKANATLKDGSILFVNEAKIGENIRITGKEMILIRRWDNAPHHRELPNFPHHLHDENDVLSSEDVNLADVLM